MRRSTEMLLDALVLISRARFEEDCEVNLTREVAAMHSAIQYNEDVDAKAVYQLADTRLGQTIELPQ